MFQNTTRHLTEQKRTEPKIVRSIVQCWNMKRDKHKQRYGHTAFELIKLLNPCQSLSTSIFQCSKDQNKNLTGNLIFSFTISDLLLEDNLNPER